MNSNDKNAPFYTRLYRHAKDQQDNAQTDLEAAMQNEDFDEMEDDGGGSAISVGQMVRHTVARGGLNVEELREEMNDLRRMITKVVERGAVEQKIFDSLHSELKDYKNDFFYERLKPIVRPLLFVYDSIAHLDEEIGARTTSDELLQKDVRANLAHLQHEIVEVLEICEVTPINETRGAFDPVIHKAVETVKVAPEQDNMVQRVVRNGWYLNGTLLRPVDVVRGRA